MVSKQLWYWLWEFWNSAPCNMNGSAGRFGNKRRGSRNALTDAHAPGKFPGCCFINFSLTTKSHLTHSPAPLLGDWISTGVGPRTVVFNIPNKIFFKKKNDKNEGNLKVAWSMLMRRTFSEVGSCLITACFRDVSGSRMGYNAGLAPSKSCRDLRNQHGIHGFRRLRLECIQDTTSRDAEGLRRQDLGHTCPLEPKQQTKPPKLVVSCYALLHKAAALERTWAANWVKIRSFIGHVRSRALDLLP